MDEDQKEKLSAYAKLKFDGTVGSNQLEDSDYDNMMKFIRTTFPTSQKVKKELEQTMKRTFAFGRKAKEKKKNVKKAQKSSRGSTGKRRLRFRITKVIPRKLNYSDYTQLHSLWKEYVADILRCETKVAGVQQRLNRADLHGAILKVTQAQCSSFVGLEGIVIAETKNTFIIVTKSNETKTVPKADTVFQVLIPEPAGIMEICGNSFVSRPAERSSKKIKGFIDHIGVKARRTALLRPKLSTQEST